MVQQIPFIKRSPARLMPRIRKSYTRAEDIAVQHSILRLLSALNTKTANKPGTKNIRKYTKILHITIHPLIFLGVIFFPVHAMLQGGKGSVYTILQSMSFPLYKGRVSAPNREISVLHIILSKENQYKIRVKTYHSLAITYHLLLISLQRKKQVI